MSFSARNRQVEQEQKQLPIRGPTWSNASIRRSSDVIEMSEDTIKQIEAEARKQDNSRNNNASFASISTSLSNIMTGVLSSLQAECQAEAKLHPMKKEQVIALKLNRKTVKSLMNAATDDDEFHKMQEAIRANGARTGVSEKAFLFARSA